MSTNYGRGAAFERQVRDRLQLDGYEVVRSAGSKSAVDLVAFKAGHTLLIQAKSYGTGTIPPGERAELIRVAQVAGGLPIVAHRDRGIRWRLLTGQAPSSWVKWMPDEVR